MVLDCSKLRETLSVDAVREDCNTVMSDFEVSLPVHPPCPLPQCLLPLHPLPGWSLWAMNRSCITLQLWHHARPVRLRSPRRSPTGSGLMPGSCVLCLCYAGETQMAKTSTSILVLKKKKGKYWCVISVSQVAAWMLPDSVLRETFQGRPSLVSSLSPGPPHTQEDVLQVNTHKLEAPTD